MATQLKSIGIPLGIDFGTFSNTEFINGVLRLLKTNSTTSGKNVYSYNGTWESDIIDLGTNKYKEFEKLAVTSTITGTSNARYYTRTSSDKTTWSAYEEISSTGYIMSPKAQYAQVRVDYTAGLTDEIQLINDFLSGEETDFSSNYLITMDGTLKLKEDYLLDMTEDTSWAEGGFLFRETIKKKTDFKKINSLGIVNSSY